MHESSVSIQTAPAMLVAGIRRTHTMHDAATTVRQQWNDFRQRNISALRGSRALHVIGAYCSMTHHEFEYMTGVEVDSFDTLPTETGRMRIPDQTYAVFTHRGHVSQVGDTWQYIWNEWLPKSGYADAETPPFEQFDERFDADSGDGEFEIWLPVRKR